MLASIFIEIVIAVAETNVLQLGIPNCYDSSYEYIGYFKIHFFNINMSATTFPNSWELILGKPTSIQRDIFRKTQNNHVYVHIKTS